MELKKTESQRQVLITTVQRAYMEIFPARFVEASLDVLRPESCVAVTCSPSKGIDATLDVAERLVERGFETVPHIAAKCVRSDIHLHEILQRIDAMNIEGVFVIGGDAAKSAGPYSTALQLLRAMSERDHGVTEIGVAAYPEGHPQADNEQLLQQLQEKQKYCHYFVTQMCFDAPVLGGWLGEVRDRGITLPAWVGLPGVADRTRLVATSLRIGVGESLRFLRKSTSLAGRFLKQKTYRPDAFLHDLLPYLEDPRCNIVSYHIFSFNQVETTEKWRNEFLATLRETS